MYIYVYLYVYIYIFVNIVKMTVEFSVIPGAICQYLTIDHRYCVPLVLLSRF